MNGGHRTDEIKKNRPEHETKDICWRENSETINLTTNDNIHKKLETATLCDNVDLDHHDWW